MGRGKVARNVIAKEIEESLVLPDNTGTELTLSSPASDYLGVGV